MTEYLIAFNDEWVPDHTVEELREKSKAVRALVAEMKAAGVFIFTGGLDDAAPVFSVDASSGTPLFTDGPFVETKEHLGGFAVVDVADEEAARLWAGKIAVACGVAARRCVASAPTEYPRRPDRLRSTPQAPIRTTLRHHSERPAHWHPSGRCRRALRPNGRAGSNQKKI